MKRLGTCGHDVAIHSSDRREKTAMDNEKKPIKIMLGVMSAIATVSAVSNLVARLFRQDLVLVLAIVVPLGGFGLLLWHVLQSGWIDSRNLAVLGTVFLASIVLAVVSWVSLSNVKVRPVYIEIVEPKDATLVREHRYLVKGTVGDSNAKVSVVVRPLEPLDYWVQDPPTIDANGNWQVNAYFGERNVGRGEKYEIIALATYENFLVTWITGNCLAIGKRQALPSSTNRSNIVTVTRE